MQKDKHLTLPNNKDLLYLLDFYSRDLNSNDLDTSLNNANNIFLEKTKLKNIIFFSLFNKKLELHSYVNKNEIEIISSLINEQLLKELKEKEELSIKDKYFLATKINNQFLAFFVFVGQVNKDLCKIHNQFITKYISKEKIINDLIEHSQRATALEQSFNDTLSVVSHELRTPLANILGFSELMLNKKIKEEDNKNFLQEIFFAGQKLGGIIDNFLDFAKIKNGNLIDPKNFSQVDLEDLCFKAWKLSTRPNDNVEITWMIDTKLDEIACDEAAITRVMVNLFTNAIKYSKRTKTKVICEIKKTGEKELLISVKDNGIGISEKDVERIFDKFYRSKNSQLDFISGSGLGLWICKEIIEAHGGKIKCLSKINQGTEFQISLRYR